MTYLAWLKIAHIATLSIWVGGLFYLPGVFAIHSTTTESVAFRRLRALTRFTYVAVIGPAAILAIVTGSALIPFAPMGPWLPLKLTAVAAMVAFHVYCGYLLAHLGGAPGKGRPGLLLSLAAAPSILAPAVLYLVLAKPG